MTQKPQRYIPLQELQLGPRYRPTNDAAFVARIRTPEYVSEDVCVDTQTLRRIHALGYISATALDGNQDALVSKVPNIVGVNNDGTALAAFSFSSKRYDNESSGEVIAPNDLPEKHGKGVLVLSINENEIIDGMGGNAQKEAEDREVKWTSSLNNIALRGMRKATYGWLANKKYANIDGTIALIEGAALSMPITSMMQQHNYAEAMGDMMYYHLSVTSMYIAVQGILRALDHGDPLFTKRQYDLIPGPLANNYLRALAVDAVTRTNDLFVVRK